jgi:hypothetical protein
MKDAAGGCNPRQVLRRSYIVRSEGASLDPANDENPLASSVIDNLGSSTGLRSREGGEVLVVPIDGKVGRPRVRQPNNKVTRGPTQPIVSVRDSALELLDTGGVSHAGQAEQPRGVVWRKASEHAPHEC